MASPRSSADEGEIVEGHGAEYSKTQTSAVAASAAAALPDDVDGFSVDRRDRNYRGRSSRSPDRASSSGYGHRNVSPRGLKRQRDDWDAPPGGRRGGDRRGSGGGGTGGGGGGGGSGGGGSPDGRRYPGRYDDGPRDRRRDRDGPRGGGNDRRRERRYDDNDDRDGRDGRDGRDARGDWQRRRRGDLRYDDVDSRNTTSKRPRTHSRSPPPASPRGNDARAWNGRDRRDHYRNHDRDRDWDRDRDRDWDRDRDRDRDRGRGRDQDLAHRFSQHTNGEHPVDYAGRRQPGFGANAADIAGDGVAKLARGALVDPASRNGSGRPGEKSAGGLPPLPQEDWVEQKPVDEEAEIRRRRQRREEILRKSRASTPMLAPSVQADKAAVPAAVESKAQVNTQKKTGDNTPGPATATASPASPATATAAASASDQEGADGLDFADDQDFMNALGKHNAGGVTAAADDTNDTSNEDGPSAADYDPTRDMEEDERREELRHGGTVAGLHGAERRESLTAGADAERQQFRKSEAAAEAAKQAADNAVDDDDDGKNNDDDGNDNDDDNDNDNDDDDMFAEDFVEKKYEAPKAAAEAAAGKAEAAAAGAAGGSATLPTTVATNGGGILEGDDPQGYYKIRRGEVLDGRYQIQATLGKGMFSGVARAWDIASADKALVAIKIMRNNDALRKGGYTEIAILQKLNAADADNKKHIVRFERAFDFRGHLCMAFENLSMNLREVLKKFGNNVGINLHGVRVYAYQIFVALAHMRRCSIIHADLKPDNILVNDSRSTLKICDLGTAIDRSDAATAHMEITPYLVSRFYRAPEIILGMPYDAAIDMWSIGCTLYELYTGKILFTGESNNQMLKAIMEIRGKISPKLYRRGELWPMHFDDKGGFLSHEHDKFQAKTTVKILPVIKTTRDLRTRLLAASVGMDDAETRDLNQFYDLLDRCLSLNPDKRILPSDALKHPFFTQRPVR